MFSSLQELAIINRSPRQSTVIAKETLELLSIDIAVRKEVLLIRSFGDINHHRYWSSFSKSLAIFVVSRFSTKRWFTQQKAANVNVNQYFPHKIPAIVPSSITVTSKWVRWRLNAPAHDYYSIVQSGADQRKHQSSASLAFVRGIHRWQVNSPHKWPVTRKMFPFDDVIMRMYYMAVYINDVQKTTAVYRACTIYVDVWFTIPYVGVPSNI